MRDHSELVRQISSPHLKSLLTTRVPGLAQLRVFSDEM